MAAEHTSATSPNSQTPQERLAQTRRAIVRHLNRNDARDRDSDYESDRDAQPGAAGQHSSRGRTSWWPILKHAGRSWWRHHPAHLAAELAAPALKAYAREKPLQLMGVAAGVGAAVVLVRPWRMAAFNRMVAGVIGSTELSGVVLSVLNSNFKKDPP